MAEITLNASERKITKKSANKQLRRNGRIPGIFYSRMHEPIAIEAPETSVNPFVFTSEVNIISLKLGESEGISCVLKDVQFDPVTDKVVHFDLQGISKDEVIEVEVPITLVGNAEGIKNGGVLEQVLHKLAIKCLPHNMPKHLEINIEKLGLNESIHAKDLNFENIEIANSPDTVIASVVVPRAQAETTPGAEEAAKEPEVITKGKAEKEED